MLMPARQDLIARSVAEERRLVITHAVEFTVKAHGTHDVLADVAKHVDLPVAPVT